MLPKEITALLPKLYSYCAYQERCRSEVRQKLLDVGVPMAYIGACLDFLEEENYWNEARFAEQFAHGKFSVKRWGKVRILHELRQRGVPEPLIAQALAAAIDEEKYAHTIAHLVEVKLREISPEESTISRRDKVARYLQQKGYAWEDFAATLREIA